MKHILQLLIVIFMGNNSAWAQTPVKLRINHLLGENTFALNQAASNNYQDDFVVNRLQYYISGISLLHDGGTVTNTDKIFLVNPAQAVDFDLGTYNFMEIEAIKFHIGVSAAQNHLDPTSFPSNHPLYPQSPSMHWGWAAGYRFIAYEGLCNGSEVFEFHALGDDNYYNQTINLEQTTQEAGATIIALDADYEKGVENIKLSLGPISHGENGEALSCIANFTNKVFSAAQTPTSNTSNILSSDIASVFPIPSTNNTVNIDIHTHEVYELQVIDVLGRLVQTSVLNTANNQIVLQQSGIYFLYLKDTKGKTYIQKISLF